MDRETNKHIIRHIPFTIIYRKNIIIRSYNNAGEREIGEVGKIRGR